MVDCSSLSSSYLGRLCTALLPWTKMNQSRASRLLIRSQDCRCASLRASLRACAWHLKACRYSMVFLDVYRLDLYSARFEKMIRKWKANIKVQVVQARAAASVAAFFMASSLRSCAKKTSEMNMHSNSKICNELMTSFKPIKSRDCVDYIEIQYHSTSQYQELQICMKAVSLSQKLQSSTRSRRPSLLRPRLSEPCGDDLVFRTMKVILQYLDSGCDFYCMQNIKMY